MVNVEHHLRCPTTTVLARESVAAEDLEAK